MRITSLALCGVVLASAAWASRAAPQDPSVADQARAAAERARAALELPRIVDSVRMRGVPEGDIASVMGEVMRRGIPANETRDVFAGAHAAIKEHGPVGNFGAFVQGRLAAGLRGRDLARAIREEHARQGKGVGKGAGRDTKAANTKAANAKAPSGDVQGRSQDARDAATKGRSDAAKNQPAAAKQTPGGPAAKARQADSIARARGKRP